MKIRIDVTDEDIRLGKRFSETSCPIARAARRAGIKDPLVVMGIYSDGKHYCLPLAAQDFVHDFDHGNPVDPFSFEIELVRTT